jgi:hypothetical protein
MSRQRTCDRVGCLATSLVALALLSTASPGLARAEEKTSGAPDVSGTFDPTRPRGLTRLRANVRPFVSMVGRSGGAIMDFTGEYYFAELPLKLSLELAPPGPGHRG